jgi:pimeloyl-ACP methyl ester carboxylesterase
MGGAIAQKWALHYPADVLGLVLISTWARTDSNLRAILTDWIALADSGACRQLTLSMLRFSLSDEYLNAHPQATSEALATPPVDSAGFRVQAKACLAHDTLERLGDIAVPTLVVSGVHDRLVRPENSHQIVQGIPGAYLASVQTGHVPFWERPLETIRIISDFIADL